MKKILTCILFSVLFVNSVYSTDFYVDPSKGSINNPGTITSPWNKLSNVFSTGKRFKAGDTINLYRGYHGLVNITGINTGNVYIQPVPGHTPTVKCINFKNAHYWYIKGLTISSSTVPFGDADLVLPGSGITMDVMYNENSHYNTIKNCYLYTKQINTNFTKDNWANWSAGISVWGHHNTLSGNHFYNGGGIQINYHSNNSQIDNNVVENVGSDCMGLRGNYCIVENNLLMNTHKVSANHNDLIQGMGSTGNIVRNNEIRAYSDPNQPFISDAGWSSKPTSLPGVSLTQGIGLFDGTFKSWIIEDNLIKVDHTIGIWILGPQSCTVKNNKIVRCGKNVWNVNGPPSIKIAMGKTGRPAINNIIIGNQAEKFYLDSAGNGGVSVGTVSNNVVSNSYTAPVDNIAPTAPTGLATVIVKNYGVDIKWTASTDNVKVVGYKIYKDDVEVGMTRTGTNFMAINSLGTGLYRVKAFDYNGNMSNFSTSDGNPEGDTESPTIPSNVNGSAQSTTSILVTWTDSTDNVGVIGYDVYRNNIKVNSNNITVLNYVDTGLVADTTYNYVIKAKDAANNVSLGNIPVSVKTMPNPIVDLTPPTMPTNVICVAQSTSVVSITWNASNDDIKVIGYDVYRNNIKVNLNNVTTLNYSDSGLTDNTTYNYVIKAKDASGKVSLGNTPVYVKTLTSIIPLSTVNVNLNGNTTIIGGKTFSSYTTAKSNGLSIIPEPVFVTTAITPIPTVDTNTKNMLNTAIYNGVSYTIDQKVVNGNYKVYLWVLENHATNYRKFDVKLETVVVATGIGQLAKGYWKKYGPYSTTVKDGSISIQLVKVLNHPHIMGLEIVGDVAPMAPTSIASINDVNNIFASWSYRP